MRHDIALTCGLGYDVLTRHPDVTRFSNAMHFAGNRNANACREQFSCCSASVSPAERFKQLFAHVLRPPRKEEAVLATRCLLRVFHMRRVGVPLAYTGVRIMPRPTLVYPRRMQLLWSLLSSSLQHYYFLCCSKSETKHQKNKPLL